MAAHTRNLVSLFSFVLKPKCNLENVSVANPGVVGGGREKEREGRARGFEKNKKCFNGFMEEMKTGKTEDP